MSDWWEFRKRRRRWWTDIFEEFDRLEAMMDEMMRRFFETPFIRGEGETKVYGPYIYGFSMTIGPDGKPIVREFGNVRPSVFGPKIREEREPLVDIMEGEGEISVIAELPGVDKEDINLNATKDTLVISVDTPQRKYYKELKLPAEVDPKSAKATYKNGVLEVKLKKISRVGKGERIKVE